jgi:hypothetical protein
MKDYLLNLHGYNGKELLMNPYTGSVACSDVWAKEAKDWCQEVKSIPQQFSELVEVEKHGYEWVEV